MIHFSALGGVTVTEGDRELGLGGPRQRRLLAVLLIHANAVVSVDRLADAVFAGAPTAAAATTLRSYVARIRRVIDHAGAPSLLETRAPGYVLRVPPEAFDVGRFERLVDDARIAMDREDAAGAGALLREAVGLWRGDAYSEFDDEEWARPEARRLAELRLVALERLVDAELACGRAGEVIPEIEALIRTYPFREAFRAQLMVGLYRTGRQSDALRALRDYRHELAEEAGLDPSPSLLVLERRILDHDPALQVTEPAGRPLRGYRLGERLGTGRDSTVYAAALPGVDRDVVVRAIRREVADDPAFIRTFEARAQAIVALRDPAIVEIHDHWREPGAAYVVERRMHGGTLADRLADGPLPPAAVAAVAARIGGALRSLADHGLVHGRVGAGSVFVDRTGQFHLGDTAVPPPPGSTRTDDAHAFTVLIERCGGTDGRAVDSAGPPANPYKGLRAFDETDAADFFGRADLLDEIVERLAGDGLRSRLVLVVGGSGTGKSSVVRAGLLPRVRAGAVPGSSQWFATTMLPGGAPFKELAEAVRRIAVTDDQRLAEALADGDDGIDRVLRDVVPDGGQLLLVVDQFEELFTLTPEEERGRFIAGLLHAVSTSDGRLRVVATLRADFYDRPLSVHRLGALVDDVTVAVPAMSPADLEAAIVEPAERVGGRVERPLVAELVGALVDQPAALPSLQFALFELADRAPDGVLGMSAYRALGGVDGAIAARAEQLYRSLDDDQRRAVRRLFERLVVVGTEGEPTRRRAARTELAGLGPSIDAMVDQWAAARLLTLDRHAQTRVPTVEVAHEALVREWPRLRGWLDEDRGALVVLGHLREAATTWDGLDRDEGALYRGSRLQLAVDVAGPRADDLPPLEREFLDESRAAHDRAVVAEDARVARQARDNRRLRLQLVAVGVALVIALVGGLVALDQRGDAQRERRVATARELAAAADASLDEDPERSMLLSLAALDATRSAGGGVIPEAEQALHRAVSASRLVLDVPGVGGSLDWSPDGTMFVTEGPEESGIIDVRDAETGASLRTFPGHRPDVNDVAFSADSTMLATTGDDGAVRVWDPATGEELLSWTSPTGTDVWGPSFSPDGTRVAAAWIDEQVVRVVDVGTGDVVLEVPSATQGTAFSPDGTRLALGDGYEPFGQILDAATGAVLVALDDGGRFPSWSPDGTRIAFGKQDGSVNVRDASTGRGLFTITGSSGPVNRTVWSPDGRRLALASDDGTARVTDVLDDGFGATVVLSSLGTSNGVFDVAFSPDGSRLMTGDFAIASVGVWDVTPTAGVEWAGVLGGADAPQAAAFTADGAAVIVPGDGGTVEVWDASGSGLVRTIGSRPGGDEAVRRVAVSPSGRWLATATDVSVDIWDVGTGEHVTSLTGDGDEVGVNELVWSPNDELAIPVYTQSGGRVVIVDRAGAEIDRLSLDPGTTAGSLSFDPSGDILLVSVLSARNDPAQQVARLWDWRAGAVLRTLPARTFEAVFDPTGNRVATSGRLQSTLEVWDAATGDPVWSTTTRSLTNNVQFSADGGRIATAGLDGTVRIWDAETGVQQLVLEAHESPVSTVAFSPDGSRLVSASFDGVVRVWALELDDLEAIARDRLTRTLTDDECREYLHVESCA